ncbi:COX1 assembly protein [Pseudovirgaria hyperparasitica]|uniref:SURF1-like protein n=1 Tax=Pseudovirgaria hyperparasitica TaxID=470096 RepID=A0A6A6W620_9PEZI|nr:COX1 assembly protein [Pseudovirgaria hyperparasitica]KAF2757474.1 COX1 assembly protein [Pseudovirgaria hyperparasitica]
MSQFGPLWRHVSRLKTINEQRICSRTLPKRQKPLHQQSRRYAHQPADDAEWVSPVDKPAVLMRSKANKKHGPGLIILALMPITAFALGTWQVQRLSWKTDLVARYEDRLVRPSLPLPPHIDPSAIPDFDYRRVFARGKFRHDQEILLGPRTHDGKDGYQVITPMERWDEQGKEMGKVLVCRGWISRAKELQKDRAGPDALPEGEIIVQGLLRQPYKKNMFTPANSPEKNLWHFPDIEAMAKHVGAEPVFVEETMLPDLLVSQSRETNGVPIGRPAAVNLRNNHTQYIITWYALGIATSIMFWMVVKKPQSGIQQRLQQARKW